MDKPYWLSAVSRAPGDWFPQVLRAPVGRPEALQGLREESVLLIDNDIHSFYWSNPGPHPETPPAVSRSCLVGMYADDMGGIGALDFNDYATLTAFVDSTTPPTGMFQDMYHRFLRYLAASSLF